MRVKEVSLVAPAPAQTALTGGMGFETVRDEVDSEAIKTMKQRLSGIETEEMRRKGLALVTQPSDLFVVTTVRHRRLFTMGAHLNLLTCAFQQWASRCTLPPNDPSFGPACGWGLETPHAAQRTGGTEATASGPSGATAGQRASLGAVSLQRSGALWRQTGWVETVQRTYGESL